jgi:hypothetical protein
LARLNTFEPPSTSGGRSVDGGAVEAVEARKVGDGFSVLASAAAASVMEVQTESQSSRNGAGKQTGKLLKLQRKYSDLAETEGFEPSIELYNPITV